MRACDNMSGYVCVGVVMCVWVWLCVVMCVCVCSYACLYITPSIPAGAAKRPVKNCARACVCDHMRVWALPPETVASSAVAVARVCMRGVCA